jgi:hypothetical protein
METIKQTLFTGWNFMRWLRLVVGIFFIIQGIQSSETLMGVVGTFFLLTAVTNTGCCGARGCGVPTQKNTTVEPEEITFEEIKNK